MPDPHRFQCSHGPVTSELLVRFATLLNDFNPAHYDLAFAKSIDLPGVIGPGTLIQGWILSDIEHEIERPDPATYAPHAVRSIDLRLRAPFLVGDVVTISYEHEGNTVTAEAKASSSADDERVVATAVVELDSRLAEVR